MKGFIEVTPQYYDEDAEKYLNSECSCLININNICQVRGSTIYYDYSNDIFNKNQSYVYCAETYEEIKAKIKEAING